MCMLHQIRCSYAKRWSVPDLLFTCALLRITYPQVLSLSLTSLLTVVTRHELTNEFN